MTNKRVFYATQAVLLDTAGTALGASDVIKGVQPVGINTTIDHRTIRDLGNPSPISILEGKPQVEASVERIIASVNDVIFPSSGGDLLADATHAKEYDMLLLVGEEAREQIDTSGASTQAELKLSYLQVSSVSYNFEVNGPFTESISFVGHNKEWSTTRTFSSTGQLGFTHSGDVARRSDYNTSSSVMPSEVEGTIQGVSISFSLDRREVLDLGKRQGVSSVSDSNKYKLLNIPVEIQTDITTVVKEKDFSGDITAQSFTNAPASKQLKIVLTIGGSNLTFDMGSENYLNDVSRSGGEAGGGGNVESTYSYVNYNSFSIS